MRKSKQFLGMTVVSLEEGQQIGSVRGLVINPASKNVAALIIEQKGWFREQKFIPFSKVHNIGEDVITIDRGNRVERGASLPEILKLFKDRVTITGSRLVTEKGSILGVVDEYYIDLQTGDIVGLEFSGGAVNNL
ncbi:MAG: PRC-barrel domain-containing protein, partial [Desulfocucumaceae bacterium]